MNGAGERNGVYDLEPIWSGAGKILDYRKGIFNDS